MSTEPIPSPQPLPYRHIGMGLVALGALGIVAVVVAFVVIGAIVSRLDAMSRAAEGPLRATARTISDASDAFDRFGTSLGEARRSAESASELVDDTAATLETLADTMSIQIFGAQPLLPAAAGFREASQQLTALGGDLDAMAESLGANVDDVERASTNLRHVRNEMNTLLAAFDTGDGSGDGIGLASVGIYLLLGWLALMAGGCLALGVLILRR